MTKADSIQDSNRYVVEGEHEGGILPSRSAEIGRTVFLRPRAHVKGPILAGDVRVESGGVRVDEAVYATREIVIRAGATPVELKSSTAAKSSIVCEGSSAQAPVIFGADVTAPVVNLSGAVVLGNVYAERAILTDCVVIGVVHVRQNLRCERSMIGSFTAERADLSGGVALLLPVAYSVEPFAISGASCVLFDDLTRLMRGNTGEGVHLPFHDEDLKPMWYRDPMSGGKRQYHILSLAGRIANLSDNRACIDQNVEMLRAIAMRDVLHPTVASPFAVSAAEIAPALLAYARAGRFRSIVPGSAAMEASGAG